MGQETEHIYSRRIDNKWGKEKEVLDMEVRMKDLTTGDKKEIKEVRCPTCGGRMLEYKGIYRCPDCEGSEDTARRY